MNDQGISVPVLMYHHVNPVGRFINVKPDTFEAQMGYLKRKGFTSLHTRDYADIMTGKRQPLQRAVLITFDDGWLDNWVFAFPVLKKYGMKAVIFLVTSQIAEEGRRLRSDEGHANPLPAHREAGKLVDEGRAAEVMLSWEEVKEMEGSGLVEVHSHTHTHRRWDKLFPDRGERNEALRKDLQAAKERLRERLSGNGDALCWPQGFYDPDYIEIAYSMGYRLMFTTETGANTPETDMKRIRRIVIGDINTVSFSKKLFIHSRPWLSRTYLRYFK